jgi:hypothetical protein
MKNQPPIHRTAWKFGIHIGNCEGVELTLLNENDDVFERSTNAQMLSFESNSTNTLLSVSYNFTVATDEI